MLQTQAVNGAKDSKIPDRDTVRLTTAQAVVRYLVNQYSERDGQQRRLITAMMGIFGHGNVSGLGTALHEYSAELPYYRPCNEQSMVHTATGYAKAMRRVSLLGCTASSGPGSMNMLTGAATATINRVPVLLFPSDYYGSRRQGVVLQQLEHPISGDVSVNDSFRPVSRFFDRILRPEQLLTALPEAMRVLTDPADTGAVTISLPQDIQSLAWDFPINFFKKKIWRIERRPPATESIEEAAQLLAAAKRPVIFAGGGVIYSQASEALAQFSMEMGIPVGETFGGKGALESDSDLHMGGVGLDGTGTSFEIARTADLIICVGTRLTDFATASNSLFQNPEVRFISINVCSHDAYKAGSVPIVADAKLALNALGIKARELRVHTTSAYREELRAAKREWEERIADEVFSAVAGQAMGQGELIRILNESSRAGDTVIAAAGSAPGDVLKIWESTGGKNAHLEFGFSCMGYELPAGLGVRLAQPTGEVFVFIGDGTYLMNPTELVTAMQEGLKITVVVSENHGYQVIRKLQVGVTGIDFGNEFRFREKVSNLLEGEYLPIDIGMNARSMGARDWKVRTPSELRTALTEARAESGSCVIVVETEPYRFTTPAGAWWDVAPPQVSEDSVSREMRNLYEENQRKLQRFYY
jgi:3D-(3,5/4)-trihydroxycyclohexane-1,2-dione acylhydrolase (decyclizing)